MPILGAPLVKLVFEPRDSCLHFKQQARADHRERVGFPQVRISEVERFGEYLVKRGRFLVFPLGIVRRTKKTDAFGALLLAPHLGWALGSPLALLLSKPL